MDLCLGMNIRLLSFISASHRISCSLGNVVLMLLVVLSFHAGFVMICAYCLAVGMEQVQEFQNLPDLTVVVIHKSSGSWKPAEVNVIQNLGFLANFQQALAAFPCWRISHSVISSFPGFSVFLNVLYPQNKGDGLLFCCLQFCKAVGSGGGEKSVIWCQHHKWNFEFVRCQNIFLELYTMITQTKSILQKIYRFHNNPNLCNCNCVEYWAPQSSQKILGVLGEVSQNQLPIYQKMCMINKDVMNKRVNTGRFVAWDIANLPLPLLHSCHTPAKWHEREGGSFE